MRSKNTIYDLNAIKRIPILQVAQSLGLKFRRTGGDTWQEADGANGGTSLTVFTGTNSFVRFSGKEQGGCSKGSVIDFVRHVRDNSNFRDACAFLADNFL